jgi:hypothetical protein
LQPSSPVARLNIRDRVSCCQASFRILPAVNRWVVKLEFVPIQGTDGRSDGALLEVATKLREEFADRGCVAHGNAGRLVVSVRTEAETDTEAEGWVRQEVYDAVTTLLPDWRLYRLVSWAAP